MPRRPKKAGNSSKNPGQKLFNAPDPGRVVPAAGALCWRLKGNDLQVLLVHRPPPLDDWTFPKGKVDPGELLPLTAVREVAEETGLDISLGRPLPDDSYRLPDGRLKHTKYWAARVPVAPLPEPPRRKEVDETRWVSLTAAKSLLTYTDKSEQLAALEDWYAEDSLLTWPFVIVRHGHAYPRSAWGRSDAERPLAEVGTRQATELASMLGCWGELRMYCSTWQRCLDTLAPGAFQLKRKVRVKTYLSEAGHVAHPEKLQALIERAVQKQRATLVCTHRPVLPAVMNSLRSRATKSVAAEIPIDDPYLRPGEALVAHLNRLGAVVAVEVVRPLAGAAPTS